MIKLLFKLLLVFGFFNLTNSCFYNENIVNINSIYFLQTDIFDL